MSEKVVRIAARKRKPVRPPLFVLHLDKEDRAMLEEVSRTEKLSKADIVRRLIRSHHRKLKTQEKIAS